MKPLRHLISIFIDFLFPKSDLIHRLESLSSDEVIGLLPLANAQPEGIRSLFAYKDQTVHDLLYEIKYGSNEILAEKIAPVLLSEIPNDSIVTFIPATQSRKEKRGFDQGLLILNALKKCSPAHIYVRDLLKWNRRVTQQSLIANRSERLENMKNALVCTQPEFVKSKNIVVLDDVCTTGATLLDAKRALEKAGAEKVILLTIAH